MASKVHVQCHPYIHPPLFLSLLYSTEDTHEEKLTLAAKGLAARTVVSSWTAFFLTLLLLSSVLPNTSGRMAFRRGNGMAWRHTQIYLTNSQHYYALQLLYNYSMQGPSTHAYVQFIDACTYVCTYVDAFMLENFSETTKFWAFNMVWIGKRRFNSLAEFSLI